MFKRKNPLLLSATISLISMISVSALAQMTEAPPRSRHVHSAFENNNQIFSIIGETLFRNVYRSYAPGKNDHFYSFNRTEGPNAGYQDEIRGSFMTSRERNSLFNAPLLGCYTKVGNVVRHSLALGNCTGQGNLERELGFLSSQPSTGLLPLYRFINPSSSDMLAVMDQSDEILDGYVYNGIIGYAIPVDLNLSRKAMEASVTRCTLESIPAEGRLDYRVNRYQGQGQTQTQASAAAERECLENEIISQRCLVELGAKLICQ